MHSSVVNLEGLSGRAVALPLQDRAVLGPAGEARRASQMVYLGRWCAPQPATRGLGFLDTPPWHPCTLPGVKLHVVHCPSSNQKLVTSSCHHDAPHRESSIILIRQHHSPPPSQSPWRAPATRYRLSSFRGPSKAASLSQVGPALLPILFSPSASSQPATLPPSPLPKQNQLANSALRRNP